MQATVTREYFPKEGLTELNLRLFKVFKLARKSVL